jgi:hypothetical protein
MKPTQVLRYTLSTFLLLTLSCSTPYYLSGDFDYRTADHDEVAILPVDVIFSGKIPADLSEADIQTIEVAEARAFQISMHNEILRSTKGGKKPLRVDIQHYSTTQKLLQEHGLEVWQTWEADPAELAGILGVDAVVKARVEKMRFLTDLESYGIEVAIRVAEVITRVGWFPWIPGDATRAKTIYADFSLIDGESGATLWNISFEKDADWREPANEIIDGVTRRAAKHFPYREE